MKTYFRDFEWRMLPNKACMNMVSARFGPDSDFWLSGIRPDSWYCENRIFSSRISGIRPDRDLYREKKSRENSSFDKVFLY